jgi:hypothetical protein
MPECARSRFTIHQLPIALLDVPDREHVYIADRHARRVGPTLAGLQNPRVARFDRSSYGRLRRHRCASSWYFHRFDMLFFYQWSGD